MPEERCDLAASFRALGRPPSGLLLGFCQRIREKTRNRLALVRAITAVARVQVAVLFKLIELVLRHDDRPHEEATFAALAVPGNRANREDWNMSNPVVLITGGLSGIGRATAVAFGKDGTRVVASGRREAEGKALEAELGSLGAIMLSFAPTCAARTS
jgi:short chain dehydrogenase